MTDKKVELKSTHRGLVGKYVGNTFWTVAGALGVDKAFDIAQGIYVKAGTSGLGEYLQKSILDTEMSDNFALIGLGIGAAVSGIVALCNAYGILGNFYRAKTVNVIDKDEGKVKETSYDLPASKRTSELKFERVIGAHVSQGLFGRMLNTGSLTLELLTYTNADSEKRNWTIPYIREPEKAKRLVLEGLPDYEGLEIKVKE